MKSIFKFFFKNDRPKITLKKHQYINAIIFSAVSILFFNYVIFILLAFTVFVIFNYTGPVRGVGFISIFFIFYLISATKIVEGDLETYLILQRVFSSIDASSLFLDSDSIILYSGSYRNTEAAGYYMYWLVARYISDGRMALEILSLFLIYLPGIISISILSRYLRLTKHESGIAYLAFFFICINPALVTHVIRQYIAGSFFLLGMSLLLTGRRFGSIMVSVLASSIHNSIILVILVSLLSYYIFVRKKIMDREPIIFNVRIIILVFLVAFLLMNLIDFNKSLIMQNDGDISFVTLLLDCGLLLCFMHYGPNYFDSKYVSIVASTISGIIILSVISYYLGLRIFSLRFYFYIELLRFFCVILIYRMITVNFSRFRLIFACLFVCSFIIFFFLKLQISPFNFAEQGLLMPFINILKLSNSLYF